MESLWDSICSGTLGQAPVPDWHAEVLNARAHALDAGTESTSTWADAKKHIRENAEKLIGAC